MTADGRPPAADELPDGWTWVNVGQIGNVIGGLTKNSKRKAYPLRFPYLRVANVYANELVLDDIKEIGVQEPELERVLLRPGDMLVVEGNGSIEQIGRVALWDGSIEPCVHQNHIIKVRFVPVEVGKYVLFWLLAPGGREHIVRVASSTSGLYTLSLSKVSSLPVPLAPQGEQRRIVAKIEALLAQSRRGREALEAVPGLLARFRQAVLAAAFRGELTGREPDDEPASVLLERIRADRRRRWEESLRAQGKDPSRRKYKEPAPPDTSDQPELPEGWVWTSLGQLLERIDAGRSPRNQGRPAESGEFGVLKVSAVTWGEFLPEENKALLPGDEPGDTPAVGAGDLLISRANTTSLVGAVVLVRQDYPNLMLSDKTLRLVPVSEDMPKEYLLYALRARWVRDYFASQATGTSDSMRNISQAKIRGTPIVLPSLAEQRRIVARIEALFAQADILEAQVAACRRRLEQVDQAVLARAFRGELVPQDPNDEPAWVLLERIRKEREGKGDKQVRQVRPPAT